MNVNFDQFYHITSFYGSNDPTTVLKHWRKTSPKN